MNIPCAALYKADVTDSSGLDAVSSAALQLITPAYPNEGTGQ